MKQHRTIFLLMGILAAFSLLVFGCEGDDGKRGSPGTSLGTVSGTVTNDTTGTPIADVKITSNPDTGADIVPTDANGNFSVSLPTGNYTVTFSKTNFKTLTMSVTSLAGQTTSVDAALVPSVGVVVDAGANVSAKPGDTVNLAATVEIIDGSTAPKFLWEQTGSVAVMIANATTATPTITLPGLEAYREELFHVLDNPPITTEDLPPNVPIPPSPFPAGLQHRFGVQGLNPFALEEAGHVGIKVTVTTSSGSYSDDVAIAAELPWVPQGGIRTVPINQPVLLHGKNQASYNWQLTAVPALSSLTTGSSAFTNAVSQHPDFTPDAVGTYTVTETVSATSFNIFAGTWVGVITGQDSKGFPEWDTGCSLVCHRVGGIAPDNFTPWSKSGHAAILKDNINDPAGHWSLSCAPCHSVGYNLDSDSEGFDETVAAEGWTAPEHPGPGEWEDMLENFSNSARRANIQCENCHGPQNTVNPSDPLSLSSAHSNHFPRVSISSDVCGVCHGEPARHARFQQWLLSAHANYELAIEEGVDADTGFASDCIFCHTGNGFIEWAELGFGTDAATETAVIDAVNSSIVTNLTDEIHPQTCPTCHSPHFPGNRSGEPNTATVRVANTTPLLRAGFTAAGVGRGAICMVCHNTRRGLRNEAALPKFDGGRSPHSGAQTDILMGQNAYFVTVGQRSGHSFLTDTCATCHMEATPPPALLSYNLGGTNHTFFASIDICSKCHTSIDGEDLQTAVKTEVDALKVELETAIAEVITAHLTAGSTVVLTSATDSTGATVTVNIQPGHTVTANTFTFASSGGRQSIVLDVSGPTVNGTFEVQLRRISISATGDPIFDVAGSGAVFSEGQIVVKAGWNLLLIEDDKSFGVHNPSFVSTILGSTRNQLATTDFSGITVIP